MVWKIKYLDEFIQNEKKKLPFFLTGYRTRVKEFYSELYSSNPEAFPLMNPVKLLGHFRTGKIELFYLPSLTGSDEYAFNIKEFNSDEESDRFNDLPKHVQISSILEDAGVTEYYAWNTSWYGETQDPRPHLNETIANRQGAMLADQHYNERNNKTKGTRFHLFDINPLISTVNDENFQYELEECLKAYNAELFLASTVTAAVCVETLLKIYVIKVFGQKSLPVHYYMTNLSDILHKNKKIDDRLNHRIKAFNELRRGSAHSKTGKVNEWDAEQGITLIKLLVEALY